MFNLSALLVVVCVLTLAVIWMSRSEWELSRRRDDLKRAEEELDMYRLRCMKAKDGREVNRTQGQLDISRAIYQNVVKEYNRCLNKPQNRLLAWIIGYRSVNEEDRA